MAKGLDYDLLFPGRFMKAAEFKGRDVTLTISKIRIEELPQDKGGDKPKGIITFNETKKELVLNRTNGECIKAMFGRDTGEWIGKHVTFYPASMGASEFGALAIRVRGSPDIAQAVVFDLKLPRKSARSVTLAATGKGRRAASSSPASPDPAAAEREPTDEELAESAARAASEDIRF
jgi:hypothetical protein